MAESIRVLIADDSKLLRERLIDMFAALEKIEVIGQAQDCSEAIESIQRLKPDVLILDIRMPGGNGIEVLETVKKYEFPPKVIVFTNYPYPQYRKKCMEAGADYFFDKSAEFENLTVVLQQLVQDTPPPK